ncbi:metal ABC transporter substrate-binding protein [Actinomycetaceae bacterium L2_0104]
MKKMSRITMTAGIASAALILSACSGDSDNGSGGSDGTISVATSFYPITWLTEEIGGENVSVTSMTPANAEPHDFELSPAEIAEMGEADIVIYVKGFQPSLDQAVESISGPTIIDLSDQVDLEPLASGEESHSDEDHEADSHEDEHDHGDLDPHFWLDPVRMQSAADGVQQALSEASPDNSQLFESNLSALDTELTDLDTSFETGLATCERRTIVTSHAAFGYLAKEYDLEQTSISGIDPEREPSPADLAAVKKVIQETGTTTVFTEELVSPKTAEALAEEAGADVAVLSTLEGQPAEGDYLTTMNTNLETLRTALACN